MAHRWSLRAQALPHRGICIWRTSKQAPGCRDIKSYRSNGKPASGVGHEETINRLSSVAGAMAMLRQLSPDRGLRSALKALMTDDVELFILRWRLEIRIDCFKVFLRGPAGSGR